MGINAWVEPDGAVVFYVSKTDAWSGNGRLLKLGRVRVTFDPPLPTAPGFFRQTLRLREGEIDVWGGPEGDRMHVRLWVDANRPAVHIEATGDRPFALEAKLELWRTKPRELTGRERGSAYGMTGGSEPLVVEPDRVFPTSGDELVWCHRNDRSCYPVTLRVQGLGALLDRFPDPLLHLTFGGCLTGAGMVATDDTTLRSATPATRQALTLWALTARTPTVALWRRQLADMRRRLSVPTADALTAHRQWWREFWNRSWILADTPAVGTGGVTANELPLRLGADSRGANRFHGRLARAAVFDRPLPADKVRELATKPPDQVIADVPGLVAAWRFATPGAEGFPDATGNGHAARMVGHVERRKADFGTVAEFNGRGYLEVAHSSALNLTSGFTLEAWIAPDALGHGGGRIIDKSKAGTANGYLLDTYPGNSLRSIVEAGTLIHDAGLTPGRWAHVAATYDPRTDEQCLFVDGRLVAHRGGDLTGAPPGVSVPTRGYLLQRFINACGGRGAYPIKFNGSIFTVDADDGGHHYDADYRRWGGCYWFQNTRLPYWSMLSAGDFDLLQPLFRMYLTDLPLARLRTQLYYHHPGAFFPETMYFWGTYNNDNYGWRRDGKPVGLADNTFIRYYWSSGLELTTLMLDYYAFTQDERFARNTLLPFACQILAFYAGHYPKRDEQGKMVVEPAQALETWQRATNPTPVIAGLRFVLTRLLGECPPALTRPQRRAWEQLVDSLPPLPTVGEGAKKRVLPAEKFAQLRNSENPELYAVFPYRLFGVGKPGLEVGRTTFAARRVKRTGGWTQDAIQAALLGLTETAAGFTCKNFRTKHRGSRFPAFWGPNFDWVPDQDHGSVAMIALQRMLLQCEGDKILLFPAWPKDWDVDFKLHAPKGTLVRGVWRDGRLQQLEVTPAARMRDVIVVPGERQSGGG